MNITTQGFLSQAEPALGHVIPTGTVFYGRRNYRGADRDLWLRTPETTVNLKNNEHRWMASSTVFFDYEEVDAEIVVRNK